MVSIEQTQVIDKVETTAETSLKYPGITDKSADSKDALARSACQPDRERRLLIILNWRDWTHPQSGGAEFYLRDLSRAFVRRGYRVAWVTQTFPSALSRETIEGIEIYRGGGKWTGYVCANRLVKKLSHVSPKPFIIESVNTIPFLSRLYASNPPTVLVHHVAGVELFIEVPFPISLGLYLMERIEAGIHTGLRVITSSEQSRASLLGMGYPPEDVTVIHPAVDRAPPPSLPTHPRSGPPSFCYIGPLKRYKGVLDVIRAFAGVHESLPGARLVIAGRGYMEKELREAVARANLSKAVTMHGFVSEAEKDTLLSEGDVFLYPSASEGGWSLAVLEAMQHGLPAIVTPEIGGMVGGGRGWIVPYGNPTILEQTMILLARNPSLVKAAGTAARDWARSISVDSAVDQFEQFFSDPSLVG